MPSSRVAAYLVAGAVALIAGACAPPPPAEPEDFRMGEDIRTTEMLAHRVEVLDDSLGLTLPVHIRAVPGGYLVADPRASDLVELTPELRVGRRLAGRGSGPGEMMNPMLLSRSGPQIGVHDYNTARVLVFDVESRAYVGVVNLGEASPTPDGLALLPDGAVLLLAPDSLALMTVVGRDGSRPFGVLPAELQSLRAENAGVPAALVLVGVTATEAVIFEQRSGTFLTYGLETGELVGRASLPVALWVPLVEDLDRMYPTRPVWLLASTFVVKDAELQPPGTVLLLARGPDFFGLAIDLAKRVVHRLVSDDPEAATLLANAASATLNGDTLTAISGSEIIQVRLRLE